MAYRVIKFDGERVARIPAFLRSAPGIGLELVFNRYGVTYYDASEDFIPVELLVPEILAPRLYNEDGLTFYRDRQSFGGRLEMDVYRTGGKLYGYYEKKPVFSAIERYRFEIKKRAI